VLSLLGHKVDRLKVPFLRKGDDSEEARERTLVARWGRFVTANAKVVFPVVLLIVLGLASTSALVRLGAADQGTQPTEQTARRAYDLLAEGFGPGFNGPVPIVVDVNDDAQAPQRIYERVQGLDGVAFVGEPQLNEEGTVGLVFVTPTSSPQDEETDNLVDALRDDVVPAATAGGNAVAYVSGQTAAFKDIGDQILGPHADLPALHRRCDVPRAGDGVPLGRDLGQGGADDDPVGLRRVRRADADRPEGHLSGSRASTRRDRSRPSCRRSPSRSCSASRWTTRSS
jgi:hypothetical protein